MSAFRGTEYISTPSFLPSFPPRPTPNPARQYPKAQRRGRPHRRRHTYSSPPAPLLSLPEKDAKKGEMDYGHLAWEKVKNTRHMAERELCTALGGEESKEVDSGDIGWC